MWQVFCKITDLDPFSFLAPVVAASFFFFFSVAPKTQKKSATRRPYTERANKRSLSGILIVARSGRSRCSRSSYRCEARRFLPPFLPPFSHRKSVTVTARSDSATRGRGEVPQRPTATRDSEWHRNYGRHSGAFHSPFFFFFAVETCPRCRLYGDRRRLSRCTCTAIWQYSSIAGR
jgi:hypothetical protein